jgi:outer membrane immunogenic protein
MNTRSEHKTGDDTMKKLLLGTVALAALAMAAPAFAADLAARPYTKAPPPMVAAFYDWSGFYIGANGGWGQAHRNPHFDASGTDLDLGSHDADGGTVGGQIGYRWQASSWVFGLEAQGNWADFKGSHNLSIGGVLIPDTIGRSKLDAFGLFTGQVGYAWNNALFYVKGGAAVTSSKYNVDVLGVNVLSSDDDTRWGGTVGAGFEYGFTPNWSAAIEYDHIFQNNHDVAFNAVPNGGFVGNANIHGDVDLVTARINYRFGGPVVARY